MRRWDGAAPALGLHWLLLLWRASLRKVIRTIQCVIRFERLTIVTVALTRTHTHSQDAQRSAHRRHYAGFERGAVCQLVAVCVHFCSFARYRGHAPPSPCQASS